MVVVEVCVGSSCHQKGSYEVIQALQEFIKTENLEEKVELKAKFCLGECMQGVSMRVDGKPVLNANPQNIQEIIENEIKTKI